MESNCSVEGDADLYGLGVRIAFYISWLTTVVVYRILPERILESLLVNFILQFSLLIATIYKIAAGTAHVGDVFIMTIFGIGGCFAFMAELAYMMITARSYLELLQIVGYLRFILLIAYWILTLWLFCHTHDTSLLASCSSQGLDLSSELVYGEVMIYYQTACVLLFMGGVIFIITGPDTRARHAWPGYSLQSSSSETVLMTKRDAFVFGYQLCSLVNLIVTIERFLKMHTISNINSMASTGQIIPLITALAGLGMVFFSWMSKDTYE